MARLGSASVIALLLGFLIAILGVSLLLAFVVLTTALAGALFALVDDKEQRDSVGFIAVMLTAMYAGSLYMGVVVDVNSKEQQAYAAYRAAIHCADADMFESTDGKRTRSGNPVLPADIERCADPDDEDWWEFRHQLDASGWTRLPSP